MHSKLTLTGMGCRKKGYKAPPHCSPEPLPYCEKTINSGKGGLLRHNKARHMGAGESADPNRAQACGFSVALRSFRKLLLLRDSQGQELMVGSFQG